MGLNTHTTLIPTNISALRAYKSQKRFIRLSKLKIIYWNPFEASIAQS